MAVLDESLGGSLQLIYWSTFTYVFQSNFDLSNATSLVKIPPHSLVKNLRVDPLTDTLTWILDDDSVQTLGQTLSNLTCVYQQFHKHALALEIFEDYIFWLHNDASQSSYSSHSNCQLFYQNKHQIYTSAPKLVERFEQLSNDYIKVIITLDFPFIVCGDFNTHGEQIDSDQQLITVFDYLVLTQHVHPSTYYRSSILDLILSYTHRNIVDNSHLHQSELAAEDVLPRLGKNIGLPRSF
ncbi:hypothetical protein HELRODRAFT_165049 [Helobdella robusta]|uniref:Endonuclease/exonuclease/phosphatase domain-containing protein n=1 Tax=Helobdella robusta TaxID=6412 RepID=T1EW72_HELRO|nr:hypothetical protein HELRODRAFT_165049 [Helobdella robusta]ESN92912.1 hypothetical protein HELRODRAFT_165049 [Helobdella robusta]